MSELTNTISQFWERIQGTLFPYLQEELGPLTEMQMKLISILEMVRIESFVPDYSFYEGRPRKTRCAVARAFVAKAVYNMDTTRTLHERLRSDKNLRRICGWENAARIPSEATFSRAFAEFAETDLPQNVHKALIEKTINATDTIVVHNSRDSTAIEAREKPVKKEEETVPVAGKCPQKKGRPKRGEERPSKEPTRIQKQRIMTIDEMLKDLPKECNIGCKKNSKGHSEHWIGYKLHLDVADGAIPLSAILTSASVHDSQVAIPLATITAGRVTSLYDLMDAAYDVPEIIDHSRSLGHVPLIDRNPRANKVLAEELKAESKRQKMLNLEFPETTRYKKRTTVERGNSRLKDSFGGRMVRVKGHVKVMCHLMFGVLAWAADQLMQLVT
jgi:hypothetical protein